MSLWEDQGSCQISVCLLFNLLILFFKRPLARKDGNNFHPLKMHTTASAWFLNDLFCFEGKTIRSTKLLKIGYCCQLCQARKTLRNKNAESNAMFSGQRQKRSAGTEREQPDFIDPRAEAAGYIYMLKRKPRIYVNVTWKQSLQSKCNLLRYHLFQLLLYCGQK